MENKGRFLLAGTVIGAITGLIAAMILSRRAEQNERTTAITAGDGVKIGAMVFGLLRAIASLDDDK
jgi:hypothetical protein